MNAEGVFTHELCQTSKNTDAENAYLSILCLGWPITHQQYDKGKLKVKFARQPIYQAYIFLSPWTSRSPRILKVSRNQPTGRHEKTILNLLCFLCLNNFNASLPLSSAPSPLLGR